MRHQEIEELNKLRLERGIEASLHPIIDISSDEEELDFSDLSD